MKSCVEMNRRAVSVITTIFTAVSRRRRFSLAGISRTRRNVLAVLTYTSRRPGVVLVFAGQQIHPSSIAALHLIPGSRCGGGGDDRAAFAGDSLRAGKCIAEREGGLVFPLLAGGVSTGV